MNMRSLLDLCPTCYTPQQAHERSGIPPDADNNKGYEASLVVLEMISLMRKI